MHLPREQLDFLYSGNDFIALVKFNFIYVLAFFLFLSTIIYNKGAFLGSESRTPEIHLKLTLNLMLMSIFLSWIIICV
jgi:hypothetical protein